MTFLQGALADRDKWSAVGECAIEKTMSVLGTKSAMLLMREAYYGTTRFDDFARRVGITKAATSARLRTHGTAGRSRMRTGLLVRACRAPRRRRPAAAGGAARELGGVRGGPRRVL